MVLMNESSTAEKYEFLAQIATKGCDISMGQIGTALIFYETALIGRGTCSVTRSDSGVVQRHLRDRGPPQTTRDASSLLGESVALVVSSGLLQNQRMARVRTRYFLSIHACDE
jgi:hypothetical protein